MLKILYILLILLLSSITGYPKNVGDERITYSQIKKIAYDEKKESKDIQVSAKILVTLNENISDCRVVDCLGSNLIVAEDSNTRTYKLINFVEDRVICDNLASGQIKATSDSSNYHSVVYYYRFLYVAIFSTKNADNTSRIHIVDCCGNELYVEDYSGVYNIGSCKYTYVGDDCYFYLTCNKKRLYFRAPKDGDKIVAEKISEKLYNSVIENTTTEEPDDNLKPLYNTKGKIIAYYKGKLNTDYFLYDENKNYIEEINVSSHGFEFAKHFLVGNKIYYFSSEKYSDSNTSDETTKKCRSKCLEINLKNGKIKCNDNFKYDVIHTNYFVEDDKYLYGYVEYYELNRKGEIGKEKKCTICDKKLSFRKGFVCENLDLDKAYKLPNKAVVISSNKGFYYFTRFTTTFVDWAAILSYTDKNEIVYLNNDNKYYSCKQITFPISVFNQVDGYDYISPSTYNGKLIKINKPSGFYCVVNETSVAIRYLNLAYNGIIVEQNSISVVDDLFYTAPEGINISNVNQIASAAGTYVYQIELSDNTKLYFMYTKKSE